MVWPEKLVGTVAIPAFPTNFSRGPQQEEGGAGLGCGFVRGSEMFAWNEKNPREPDSLGFSLWAVEDLNL
jgi:hypothetical protein